MLESIEKQALIQLRADDMERYVNDLRTRYELQCDPNALSALMQEVRTSPVHMAEEHLPTELI